MRKILGLFAAAVLMLAALSLTACSDDESVSTIGGADGPTSVIVSGTAVSGADIAASMTDAAVSGADTSASDRPAEPDWRDGLEGEKLAIAEMLISSTDAFNAENVDAYMSYIDTSSAGYDSTRADTAELFDNYQLIASIDDVVFDKVSEDKGEAEVTVTQTTVRDGKEGKGFAPVQNVLSHKLVKKDGRWLFSSTTVISRRELTDRWDLFVDFVSDPPSESSSDAPEEP